ncbi:TetR family transcriptional regulator C-terminal domain-containing protein [uncultured Maritalea sp.]|jgi:TetR/AcrR family transcriptional regulator|uniref:TetR family transcriptional regulator C-terminal domain-containing protein n=1 Tax=uncultured Maritalea sp. TaxID=757249 RepID=UPI002633E080|nr:TetR family transcriptional regulator C-terminal domain-containing protein [uncultured Maritalea sp.]
MTNGNFKKPSTRGEKKKAILTAAEKIFAEYGFKGATTQMIADLAGIPKANLHYYFPTKEALYSQVVQTIFDIWLEAADSFDQKEDPASALESYIDKKMEISRDHPNGSKVWANEVTHGAPIIQDYLETTLKEWTTSREAVIQSWIDEGRMDKIDPKHLLYMIWATTQHYADFVHQVETLNDGQPFDDGQWRAATRDVKKIILTGVGLKFGGDDGNR